MIPFSEQVKNYYPQMFLGQCKYVVKEKKFPKYIISSDSAREDSDETSDEESSDKESSDEKYSDEEN